MPSKAPERILAGPLALQVAQFGAPLALGMGLQTLFNLVDAYIVARLDQSAVGAALGAIGICDQLVALGTIVSYGLTVATGSMISRKWGERDYEGTRHIAQQSLICVAALSLTFGLLGVLGTAWLVRSVVGIKGQVAALSISYLKIMLAGSASIFLLLHLTTLQRALGSSKTPVMFLLLANVLNFLLAVLLVYGPGPSPPAFAWGAPIARTLGLPRLELMGAAWATLIARTLVLFPLAITVVRRFQLFTPLPRFKLDLQAIHNIIRLSWPSSAQLVMRMIAMLITHSLVARTFTTEQDQSATTALGVVFRLETMALFVALGWGSAAQTFMGQNLGAANPKRAKRSGWYAALYSAIMMAGLALVYRFQGPNIVRFFDPDPEIVHIALSYLTWVSASYVLLGVGIVLGAAIQGSGATLRAFLLDAVVVLGFQVPASVLVVLAQSPSQEHLWQVVALAYCVFALVYIGHYHRGHFLKTAVL